MENKDIAKLIFESFHEACEDVGCDDEITKDIWDQSIAKIKYIELTNESHKCFQCGQSFSSEEERSEHFKKEHI